MEKINQTLDSSVVNVMSAIKKVEGGNYKDRTGDGGSSAGAYQWNNNKKKLAPNEIPINFQNMAKSHGLNPLDFSPANQNKVAYAQIKKWKDQGLQPDEIAALWNGAQKDPNTGRYTYINPEYGVKFRNNLSIKTKTPKEPEKTAGEMADMASAEKYKPTFASKSEGTAVGEAIRTVGNIPSSAFGFVKGALDIINPVSTVNKVKEIISGTKEFAQEQGGMGKAIWEIIKQTPETAYEVLVPEVARKVVSGDFEEAQRAIVNDPVGQILPFIIAAKGGAKVADTAATKSAMAKYVREPFTQKTIPKPTTKYSEAVDTTISKVGQAGMQPFKSAFSGAGKVRDYGISQATGLNPETIRTVKESPKAFTKKAMADIDRATIGRQVQSKLGQLAEEKSSTGKEYQPIRESGKEVKVDPTFWDDTFKETTGLEIKKGQLTPTTTSKVRDAGDVRALQKVYEFWKPKFKDGKMTADEYLNMREDLAKASKFEKDLGKRKDVEILAGQIRAKLNQAYRPQIEGLSALDETMRSQILEYKELAKGLVDKDGIITDAGMAKIANLSKNKPRLAEQLERIVPGITQQVKVLQAIADIERASGIKVGTYTRAAATGGAFLGGGPIAAIVTAVLTSPEVAVPLLRQYGLIKNSTAVRAVTNALRESAGFVNKLPETAPGYLQKDTRELPMGMSIEDVSKNPIYKNFNKDVAGTSMVEKGNLLNTPDASRYAWRSAERARTLIENADLNDSMFKIIVGKSRADIISELNKNIEIYSKENVSGLPEKVLKKNQELINFAEQTKKEINKPSAFSPKGKGVVAPEKTTAKTWYHGTTPENKASILKNGIDTKLNKKGFAEQPEAFYVGDKIEAGMYGKDFVGVRVKNGENPKILDISSKEWAETVGKSTSSAETASYLRELRNRGYDAVNHGDELEILNPKKFEVFDPEKATGYTPKEEAMLSKRFKEIASGKDLEVLVGKKNIEPGTPQPQKIAIKDLVPSEHDTFAGVKDLKGGADYVKQVKQKIINGEEMAPASAIKHVDDTGIWYEIEDGHHKIQAAIELGIKEFPVQVRRTIEKKKPSSNFGAEKTTLAEDALVREARKYKSAEEFVKAQLDKNSFTMKVDRKVYRGEGKGIGNSTLVNGQYLADTKEFASQFGNVTEEIIPKGSKVFDLDKVKSGNGVIPQEMLVDQRALTKYLIDNGFDYTKNTNTRGTEFVKLNKSLNELETLASQSKNLSDFKQKVMSNYDKYRAEISRQSENYTNADWSRMRSPLDDIYSNVEKKGIPNTKSQLEEIWNKANKKSNFGR